jgi:2-haloacid dehalogenase
MRPDLITFDAYAALADYRSSLLPALEDVLGLDSATASDFLDLWRARQLGITALSNALEQGRISFRQCTALALDYTLNRHRLDVDASSREDLIRAWYPLKPWPEANRVLAALAAKGFRLAILSNGDEDMLEAIAAQLDTPFDHIFSSEQCGLYKPHPSVYGIPGRTLGVENYLHVAGSANDVVGARAAGVSCYWSNRQGDRVALPDYAANYQGSDLTGILAII